MIRIIIAILLIILLHLISRTLSLDGFVSYINPLYPVSLNLDDGDKRKLNINVDSKIASKHYDYTTLFYNIFLDYNNQNLVFVGPLLYELNDKYMDFSVYFNGSKTNRSHEEQRSHLFCLKYGVENVNENNSVEIHINGHKKQLTIAKNNYKCGNRILITKQKNNKPKWIIDWINHYTHRYNVTNIVIFDNNSDDFDGLKRQLESFSHVSLIPYNFPFGVPRKFPSNFLQHNLMEIGFQQFCKDDVFIFNFDIDELLVVDPAQLNSVLSTKDIGYKVDMWWVPMLLDGEDYSYKDFKYKEPNKTNSGNKYIVNKRNTKHLGIHYVITTNKMVRDGGYFLHFKGINTNWKYKRAKNTDIDTSTFKKIDEF